MAAPALREEPAKGIAYMVAAIALFSLMSALVKFLGTQYPIGQLMFFRNAAALVPALAIVAGSGGLPALATRRPFAHLLRAITGMGAMSSGFFALSQLPLVDATAISFTNPLFLTVLAIPILGERVGIHRAGAVVVGFAGVLVLAAGQGGFTGGFSGGIAIAGMAAALANAFLSACTALMVRQLSATEGSATITAWQSLLMTGFCLLLLPFGWVNPGARDLALLAGIGLTGGVAQYWMTQAYRFGAASVVGAFTYTAMVWAVLFGWLVWGEVPGRWVLAGSAIVIAAGLYILYREVFRARQRGA
jgi:drug/metabolite transporter (DMT)-like permease